MHMKKMSMNVVNTFCPIENVITQEKVCKMLHNIIYLKLLTNSENIKNISPNITSTSSIKDRILYITLQYINVLALATKKP